VRRILAAVVLVCCGGTAFSAIGADAKQEIAGLIDAIGRSGCEFERNGSWHDAGEAQGHLQRKYAWLRKRHLANTTEQFIDRAASRSSVSGKPYHVRCAGKPVVDSATWFGGILRGFRNGGPSRGTR
jgi:uncharacterized protein DUF5329